MTTNGTLGWLQQWYLWQCDGDWEHQHGVRIGTLDNPGWEVRVDLSGTSLCGRDFGGVQEDRTDRDWLHCRLEDKEFVGFGGPENLREILDVFKDWVQTVEK